MTKRQIFVTNSNFIPFFMHFVTFTVKSIKKELVSLNRNSLVLKPLIPMKAFFLSHAAMSLRMIILSVLLSFSSRGQQISDNIINLESQYILNQNAQSLETLINLYLLESRYAEAERIVLDYKKTLMRDDEKALVYLCLARINKYLYQKDKALGYFYQTKKLLDKQGSPQEKLKYGIEFIEYNRKNQYFEQAQHDIEFYKDLIEKEQITNPKLLCRFYNRYAAVMNELSQTHESIKLSHKALEYAKKAGDKYELATTYNELGFAHKHANAKDSTIYYYDLAENIFRDYGYTREAVYTQMNRIEFSIHNYYGSVVLRKAVIEELERMIEYIDKHNVDYPKSKIYLMLEAQNKFLGDFESAYKYCVKSRDASSLEAIKEMEKSFHNIKEQYENEKLIIENSVAKSKAKHEEEKRKSTQIRLVIILVFLIVISILCIMLYIFWLRLRKKNRELLIRNHQKTMLVQEIHHRVKNNLQFVQSILKMQQRVKDLDATQTIKDISRRIDAMSLVHEMLYVDDDSMTVSVKDYLEKLLKHSKTMYNIDDKLSVSLDIEQVDLRLEKLIAMGLICSELLSNSVKHVFPHTEAPKFSIRLTGNQGKLTLEVFDNGTESEADEDEERTKLGMRLIDIFSRQLDGVYSIDRRKGYLFRLVF